MPYPLATRPYARFIIPAALAAVLLSTLTPSAGAHATAISGGATGSTVSGIDLGAATTYSVLGASAVTNTGPTWIGGDLGVSPGTAITGVSSGQVGGTQDAGDSRAQAAQAALSAAFDDAASRTPTAPISTIPYQLGGSTLGPGVYSSTTSMQIAGTLTLDGGGDPHAIFIFQMGSTLTTLASSHIVLINGASAANVFWQVGSGATLGTFSTFAGTIMAASSVTVTTGVTVNGRVLAKVGAVTLDSDNFTNPLGAAPTIAIDGGAARSVSNRNPAITGTTDAADGSPVTVFIDGVEHRTTADHGAWSVVSTTELSEGTHSIVASVVSASGYTATSSQTLTVDTTAPTVTIAGGTDAITTDSTPTISGTTDAPNGTAVDVAVDGNTYSAAAADGLWSVKATSLLADGAHSIIATTADEAGNVGRATQTLTYVVGETSGGVAATIAIAGGAVATSGPSPTIAGTSDATDGTPVTVTIDGEAYSTVLENGRWSISVANPLADGAHAVVATITTGPGLTSSATQTLSSASLPVVTIDGGANAISDATPTITGTAAVADSTTVSVVVNGKTYVGSVHNGTWSVDVTNPLPNGVHQVVATVTDSRGNEGKATQALTTHGAPVISIDGGQSSTSPSSTPTISGATNAPDGTIVSLNIDGNIIRTVASDGIWSVQVSAALIDGTHVLLATFIDSAGNSVLASQILTTGSRSLAEYTLAIDGGANPAPTNSPSPVINGTTNAPNGSVVSIAIDGAQLSAVVSDETWSVSSPTALTDGPHIVTGVIIAPTGRSRQAAQLLTIDTEKPLVAIDGGDALGAKIGDDVSISGTTDAPDGTNVALSIAGKQYEGSATGGAWSIKIDSSLAVGDYPLIVSIADPAGNIGTAHSTLTIDRSFGDPLNTLPSMGSSDEAGDPGDPADPSEASGASLRAAVATKLASTGADVTSIPVGLAALALGYWMVGLNRRKRRRHQ